jgi:hypothetical protein
LRNSCERSRNIGGVHLYRTYESLSASFRLLIIAVP